MQTFFLPFIFFSLLISTANSTDLNNFDAASQSTHFTQLHSQSAHPQQTRNAATNKYLSAPVDQRSGQRAFIWASAQLPIPTVKTALTLSGADISEAIAREYLQVFYATKSTNKISALNSNQQNATLLSIHNTGNGPIIAKFQQAIDGTEVFARNVNIMMNQDHRLVAVSGFFANTNPAYNDPATIGASTISTLNAQQAVLSAYRDLGVSAHVNEQQTIDQKISPYTHFHTTFDNNDLSTENNTRAKQVWYELNNKLIPAFYVEVNVQNNKNNNDLYYSYVISAENAAVLFRKNLTEHENFHYRTFVDTQTQIPLRGPMGNIYPVTGSDPVEAAKQISLDYDPLSHSLISLPHGPISTADPWLTSGAQETHGNNVDAYADINPGDGLTPGDFRADTTAHNTFGWTYNPEKPDSIQSQKAAIVNLFYVNNWLHDYYYDRGFKEVDGNAQKNNYGRGGEQNDELRVEAQDYSGRNNANMSTPADGAHPRMQMYNFSGFEIRGKSFDVNIDSPQGLTLIDLAPAKFGNQAFPLLTANLVSLNDGNIPASDGCQPAINANELRGNIAMIDRGMCAFAIKVKHAQDAGAIAALVANNRDAIVPSPMGGTDSSVLIPSFGVTQNDGLALYPILDAGNTVTLSLYRNFSPDRDGTLANGIVAHEWGHYLSNRLASNASGLVNNQGRSMGEGWGDFMAIFMSIKEQHASIPGNERYQGLYSSGSWVDPSVYFGIRRVPYSTNTQVNATSFKHIDNSVPFTFTHPVAFTGRNSEVHAAGEIWATMLLDAYTSLLNDKPRLSFVEAQNRMAEYLIAGMKMLPFAPTFVEARDGILAAAYARDEKDYRLLIQAFAKRGLGMGAIAPERMDNQHRGVIESYSDTLASYELISSELIFDLSNESCPADNILDVEEHGLLRVTIRNNGNINLKNIKAMLTSSADIEFKNNGLVTFKKVDFQSGTHTADIYFELNSAKFAEKVEMTLEFLQNKHNPEVITPDSKTLALTVNFAFAPDKRLTDNNENTLTTQHDWLTQVDYAPEFVLAHALSTFEPDAGRYDHLFNSGQMWFGRNNAYQSDVSLLSPVVNVGHEGAFTFSFDHAHWFELDNWDGGILEIKIGNGQWQDVIKAGAVFHGYGYNGIIRINAYQPLSGQPGFVNENGVLNHTTVDFGTALNGQQAQLRFRIGTDSNTSGIGWVIDNMAFQNISNRPFSKMVRNKDDYCDDVLNNGAPR